MNMHCTLAVLLAVVGLSSARMAFQLPARSDDFLLEPLDQSFSCQDRGYGYYADVSNNCQLFHVCDPIADEIGAVKEINHFTFMCGNGTLFNQRTLVCQHTALSPPCEQSVDIYERSNSYFGQKIEREFEEY